MVIEIAPFTLLYWQLNNYHMQLSNMKNQKSRAHIAYITRKCIISFLSKVPNKVLMEMHSIFLDSSMCLKEQFPHNKSSMKEDFKYFFEVLSHPEEVYTCDLLLLLESKDPDNIAKVEKLLKIRTGIDFYLLCYVISYMFNISISYLAEQINGENKVYFDSKIIPKKMTQLVTIQHPPFP